MDDKEAVKIVEGMVKELEGDSLMMSRPEWGRERSARQKEALSTLLAKQVAVDEMLAGIDYLRVNGVEMVEVFPGEWAIHDPRFMKPGDKFKSLMEAFAALQAKEKENNG